MHQKSKIRGRVHKYAVLSLFGLITTDQGFHHCQARSRKAVRSRLDNGGSPDTIHQAKQDAADSDIYRPKNK